MDAVAHNPAFWIALALGLVLMVAELFVPATVFLWTGISALAVAILFVAFPNLSLLAAIVLWVVLSFVTVLVARHRFKSRGTLGERTAPKIAPNQYGSEFVGQTTVLKADSENGETRVNLNGASWGVRLPKGDLKAGTKIRITGIDNIMLIAEPVTQE
jgi:membrane protein implicated in regulation of membrane protease activity